MKEKAIKNIFIGTILCICFAFIFYINSMISNADINPKKVLIINSYNKGFKWTDSQTDEIMNTLRKDGASIEIFVEYLDWKHHPHKESLEILKELYKHKYGEIPIDMIITTDDAALEFAIENRKELFRDAPISFSGVFKEKADILLEGTENITGVYEVIDSYGTLQLALKINPNISDIYLIYDNSESGIGSAGNIETAISQLAFSNVKIHKMNHMSLDEINKTVTTLHKDSIIIMGSYSADFLGLTMEQEEFSSIISKFSSVPIYDVYDFRLGSGVVGGSVLSSKFQGAYSGSLAKQILEGQNIESLKPINKKTVEYKFDYIQLQRYNIDLAYLPKESIVINKPFSFYETYKNMVIGIIIIFLMMSYFITVLLLSIHKRIKAEEELKQSNTEVLAVYQQLAASDNELKRQLEEITSSKNLLQEKQNIIENLAFYDQLTKLPNRESLKEYIDSGFKECSDDEKHVLIYIDLDDFKLINDTFGHTEGDRFLVNIGDKLNTITKQNNACAFRIGGDEFVITLKNIGDKQYVTDFLEDMITIFKEPFLLEENYLNITFCAGIVLYPDDGNNYEELLKNADTAMYNVKEHGKNGYAYYENFMNKVVAERVSILNNLKNAIANNEFSMNYQPQYHIDTKKIIGIEALIRWNNPQLGLVPPDKFISIAEESGLIIEIGDWVLKTVCDFTSYLWKNVRHDIIVSLNISTIQLVQSDFVYKVKSAIQKSGIPPHSLGLEITESTLLAAFESNVEKLEELKRYGVKISLDDFGKGYSSLTYLMRLPIDIVKIDKSFVDDIMLGNKDDWKIIGSIVQLAHNMNLSVVAEGVELVQQLDFLESNDCDVIQGYIISRPLTEERILKFVTS